MWSVTRAFMQNQDITAKFLLLKHFFKKSNDVTLQIIKNIAAIEARLAFMLVFWSSLLRFQHHQDKSDNLLHLSRRKKTVL